MAKAPWRKSNPRKRAGKKTKHLSAAKKRKAKARAKKAGRPYPNLVDNMAVASGRASRKKKTRKKAKKKAKRTSRR